MYVGFNSDAKHLVLHLIATLPKYEADLWQGNPPGIFTERETNGRALGQEDQLIDTMAI